MKANSDGDKNMTGGLIGRQSRASRAMQFRGNSSPALTCYACLLYYGTLLDSHFVPSLLQKMQSAIRTREQV